jgi:hypothetical protein
MVIAHTGIKVEAANIKTVVAWYEAALAPLGYKKAMVFMDGLVNGFSDGGAHGADWWVSAAQGEDGAVPVGSHHAFAAKG